MNLFSLHVGKSQEVDSRCLAKIPRHLAIGDIRTHIRVPGGLFAVSIFAEDGQVVYAAVNAGPMEANGHIAVRWKVPSPGTYKAILWKQRDRLTMKMFGAHDFETFTKGKCTKVTEFRFSIV